MTAPPAVLCGHRWAGRAYCPAKRGMRGHTCAQPDTHDDPCRCWCGATTTNREDT